MLLGVEAQLCCLQAMTMGILFSLSVEEQLNEEGKVPRALMRHEPGKKSSDLHLLKDNTRKAHKEF